MVFRMVASIIVWVATTAMTIALRLRDRDLLHTVAAATISTIAIWWGSTSDQTVKRAEKAPLT